MEDGILYFLSLLITAACYAAFPLGFILLRKRTITKRMYSTWCFAVNLVVWILLGMLALATADSPSSGAAFVFWTWIFSRIGAGMLKDNGILDDKPKGGNPHDPS